MVPREIVNAMEEEIKLMKGHETTSSTKMESMKAQKLKGGNANTN